MTHEGPQLESLTHRLAECPPEFLLPPRTNGPGQLDVPALVADHFRAIDRAAPPYEHLAPFINVKPDQAAINRLRLVAIATWLLRDAWFLARPDLAAKTWELFVTGLDDLAKAVRPDQVVSDPDRREEFTRLCLARLDLRPQGESIAQAADRLTTLDSSERERVIRQTREAESRAREIRERLAREAAEAAAQRYSPE
jgi:hypothetical protein